MSHNLLGCGWLTGSCFSSRSCWDVIKNYILLSWRYCPGRGFDSLGSPWQWHDHLCEAGGQKAKMGWEDGSVDLELFQEFNSASCTERPSAEPGSGWAGHLPRLVGLSEREKKMRIYKIWEEGISVFMITCLQFKVRSLCCCWGCIWVFSLTQINNNLLSLY